MAQVSFPHLPERMTASQARKQGYTINTNCYPWLAYKRGCRDDSYPVFTDLETTLIEKLRTALDDASRLRYPDTMGS